MVFHFCVFHPEYLSLLAFSREAPWGLATSLLAHVSYGEHLLPNLQGLLTYTFAAFTSIVILSVLTGWSSAWRLSWGYVGVLLLSHSLILSVQACLLKAGTRFFGMSLAVFSLYGYSLLLTLFALGGLAAITVKGWKVFSARLRKSLAYILALCFLNLLLLAFPLLDAGSFSAFLGAGKPQANVAGHLAALLAGMILGFPVLTVAFRRSVFQKI
jgi:hypothetical protein